MTDPAPPQPAPQPAPQVAASGQVGQPRGVGVTILLSIVTLGIWTVIWSYWNGEEIKGYRPAGLGGVAYAVITFFISPVTMFLMAGEVEKLYTEDGREAPITTIWGLWFLLPLIGHLIWYVRIQNSINDFWIGKGAAPSTGAT